MKRKLLIGFAASAVLFAVTWKLFEAYICVGHIC